MRVHEIGSDGKLFTVTSGGTESFLSPVIPFAASETRTDAGAVSVATYNTNVVTTGAAAITLADGAVKGQLKRIQFITDAGDATLTIASPISASLDVIVFADIGDTVELVWTGAAWRILAAYNCADGTTAPAVS